MRRMNGSGSSAWPTAKALTGGANSQRETRGAGGPDLQEVAQNWPTAVKTDANGARSFDLDGHRIGANAGPTLNDLAANWTTPQAPDVSPRGSGQVPSAKAGNACLARDAENWGTPRASDAEKGGPNQSFGAGGIPLPAQAATWPTPASRDHKGENGEAHLTNGTGRLHMDQLPNFVAHAFSRPDLPTRTHGPLSFTDRRTLHRLLADKGLFALPSRARHSYSPPTRKPPRNPARAAWREASRRQAWLDRRNAFWTRARLNPSFVEWLMGWPPGHALCDCSATEFIRWQQDMRGALSALPMTYGPWIWKPQAGKAKTTAPEQLTLI